MRDNMKFRKYKKEDLTQMRRMWNEVPGSDCLMTSDSNETPSWAFFSFSPYTHSVSLPKKNFLGQNFL